MLDGLRADRGTDAHHPKVPWLSGIYAGDCRDTSEVTGQLDCSPPSIGCISPVHAQCSVS